ncbi:glycosyltransferase family 2 protein [Amphritea pacifica]|uniref:glycosyltransferase family 2 protein n=1 Tax=Amphritea pacifica TaxID=2811233 RepID=UPI001965BC36|nr:glycosyltransferase family 2 protein [Amphritea pacifica]MBN1005321.1 glycosyltransferase [Amphritea pacifica]
MKKKLFKKSVVSHPLITVVTVVYNGEDFIEETIRSVINQTYDNVEYIIVDGGSTDSTLDIIRKYDHAIDYWISEEDDGIYDAWNKAIKLSNGDWIAFLGADDTLYKKALSNYVDLIKGSDLNYVSARVNLIGVNGYIRTIGSKFDADKISKSMNVAHVGSLHSRKLFEQCGCFSLKYKIVSDYDFFIRNVDIIKPGFLDVTVADMRVEGASDGGFKVFYEVAKVKIDNKIQGRVSAYASMVMSFCKWRIRRLIWY